MNISQIVPGCFHVEHRGGSAIFGSPPEILKFILKSRRMVPTTVVLPDVSYAEGVSQIALEFLAYWHLFYDQTDAALSRFRIIGSEDMCERVRETLLVTLFGPSRAQMRSWKLSKTRIAMLANMMDYMAIRRDGHRLTLDDMVEFIHLPDDSPDGVPLLADGDCTVRRVAKNVFRVDEDESARVIDLFFEGRQLPLMVGPDVEPEVPQVLRVKLLGTYSGFDTDGPTTGMVMWINCNGFLVDGPVGTSDYLHQLGIPKSDLAGVILSHVHDDHCTLMDMILSEQTANIITTREIYECMLIKISNVLGETIDEIRNYLTFTEVIPGKPFDMYGARWEFFYTVHSIPTIGFRVSVRGPDGKEHTVVHSSDTAGFSLLGDMRRAGAITTSHENRMMNLVRGGERLVMIDGGGPPIHGNPADFKDAMRSNRGTDFLFYHVNPENVDTSRYPVATPGWGRTYLESPTMPQSLVLKLLKTMNLLEVHDIFWVNVVFSQGRVLEVPPGHEVIRQGGKGDSFYFILSGSGEVLDKSRKKEQRVALLEAGDFFGEMSIIRETNRNATVRTLSSCILFQLPGDLFLEFVDANELKEKFERLWLSRSFISRVRIFRNLQPHAKHEISLLSHPETFAEGTVIVRQGGKSDDFYIITSGCAEVVKKTRAGEQVQERLGPGDFFGENVAMGYSSRRNASVVAVEGPLEAMRIPGAELRRLAETAPVLTHELHLVMRERGMTDIPSVPRESTGV